MPSLIDTSTDEQPLASSFTKITLCKGPRKNQVGASRGSRLACCSYRVSSPQTKTGVSFVMSSNHIKTCKRDSGQHDWF